MTTTSKPGLPGPSHLGVAMLLGGLVAFTPGDARCVELLANDKVSLSVGGFAAAQTTFDTNDSVVQSHLTQVPSTTSTGRTGFAFDSSRLRLDAAGHGAVEAAARFEFDLESAINFRVRHAYVAAKVDSWTFTVGQTDTLIGNAVGPHLWNNDWLWSQGNAYGRSPQARVSYDRESGLSAAVAVVPSPVAGRGAVPHGQARLGYRWNERGEVGLAGHLGVTEHADHPDPAAPSGTRSVGSVVSWLIEADTAVPLGPLTLSVEAWYGKAAGHGTGGHTLGGPLFVVDAQDRVSSVPAYGGFADVLVSLRPDLHAGVVAGANIVAAETLGGTTLPVRRNVTAGAYVAYSLLNNVSVGVDVQWASTLRATSVGAEVSTHDARNLRGLLGMKFGL